MALITLILVTFTSGLLIAVAIVVDMPLWAKIIMLLSQAVNQVAAHRHAASGTSAALNSR